LNTKERVVRKQSGFTLIELMITVTVVAILASIAVPSYTDYVTRGRIPEATSALADMRVRMEQFFQDSSTYVGAPICATLPTATNFTFLCPVQTATTFTLSATGTGSMTGFVFTINQNGARATTGVKSGWTANNTCWVARKNGACS
jgi:type IV pilus assembly protein PilE